MDVYVVSLELYCDSDESAALDEFDKRWTSTMKLDASVLVWDANGVSEDDLKNKLDAKLYDLCSNTMAGDFPGKQTSASNTFGGTGSTWSMGAGGLHEGSATVYVILSDTTKNAWEFNYGIAGLARMFARARWKKVTVQ